MTHTEMIPGKCSGLICDIGMEPQKYNLSCSNVLDFLTNSNCIETKENKCVKQNYAGIIHVTNLILQQ